MLSAKLIPIRGSSCFDASGYFGGRAAFRYRSGRVIYRDIPIVLWQRFMEEKKSKGRFFNNNIKFFARAGNVSFFADCQHSPARFSKSRDGDGVVPPSLLSQVPAAECSTGQVCQRGNPEARFNLR